MARGAGKLDLGGRPFCIQRAPLNGKESTTRASALLTTTLAEMAGKKTFGVRMGTNCAEFDERQFAGCEVEAQLASFFGTALAFFDSRPLAAEADGGQQ